ncbi:MAG: GNAT family N-acetyltransferase [Opitutaceae bacterium]|nr:GNAT family N-acetyltransferase [Opitutaceae bacterium]
MARLPNATVFHGAGWCRALVDTYGYKPLYLTLYRAGELAGLLPLMEVRSPITGLRGVSLPFTDDCDPLAVDDSIREALLARARVTAKERGWKYVEFRFRIPSRELAEDEAQPDCRGGPAPGGGGPPGSTPAADAAPRRPCFYSHTTDLTPTLGPLEKRIHDSARRSAKKALKEGVTAEIGHDETALREYYQLHCLARKGHGLPPQSFGFFLNLHRHLIAPRKGFLVLARLAGRPIAGAVYFTFGTQATYKFGASDTRFLAHRPNHLVMLTAMTEASRLGCTRFDFGRTSLWNEGLRFYKSRWASEQSLLAYERYVPESDTTHPVADGAKGGHTRLFKTLPVFASRLIGTLLYRHMA